MEKVENKPERTVQIMNKETENKKYNDAFPRYTYRLGSIGNSGNNMSNYGKSNNEESSESSRKAFSSNGNSSLSWITDFSRLMNVKINNNNHGIRTTKWSYMEHLFLTDPDSISRDEFLLYQSSAGFRHAKGLLEEGRRRKELAKNTQLERSTAGSETINHNEVAKQEPIQIKKENKTGLPDNLKAGVENLSGLSMDDVRVHYNSDKPSQVGALAYTQGTDIHVASGQENHLPHEAWHAVQQAQGRVQSTKQLKSVQVNDDIGLEHEADVMGVRLKENNAKRGFQAVSMNYSIQKQQLTNSNAIQRTLKKITEIDINDLSGLKATPETGFGATVNGTVKTLKTKVNWGPLDTSGEGTSVDAVILGPDHKLGSKTGSNGISERVQNFNKAFTGTWKQGHLLNDGLGGPGNKPENLVAISASTNSNMSNHFENALQDIVNKNGKWVHFKIDVTHNPITSSESKNALEKFTDDPNQLRYASSLKVVWGELDEDGAPTNNNHEFTLSQPEPITDRKKAPKTAIKTEDNPTGNVKPQAITTIAEDEVVLDYAEGVLEQVSKKQSLLQEEQESNIIKNIRLLTPARLAAADDETKNAYSDHKRTRGDDIPDVLENLKKRRKRLQPNEYGTFLRTYNNECSRQLANPELNFPKQLKELLKAKKSAANFREILDQVKPKYPALGDIVSKRLDLLDNPDYEDFELACMEVYKSDVDKFKEYFNELKSKLT